MNTACMNQVAFLVLSTQMVANGQELIQANLVWRHGDRSSRHTYPTDPYKDVWKDGSMQLTEQGMSQEFGLGLFLRSKYGHLLSEKYREGEIFIQSTNIDRTIMSAQCVAAGLYAPNNITKWKGIFSPWRPFPVHTGGGEWLHQMYQDPGHGCPEYDKLMRKIRVSSAWYAESDTKYAEFFKNITKYTGSQNEYTVDTITGLYDNLFCLKSNGYKLPDWVDGDSMETLTHLVNIKQGLIYSDYEKKYSKTLSKMRAGIILSHMLENMEKRIRGETKYFLVGYSAHDVSVCALLSSMGAYNWLIPPYASCAMIDLYREKDGSYFVKFSYRNDSNSDPYPFSFYDCGHTCSYEMFKSVAAGVVTDGDTPRSCGIYKDNKSCSDIAVPLGILVTILGLCIAVSLCFCVARKRKSVRSNDVQYSPLPMHMTGANNQL